MVKGHHIRHILAKKKVYIWDIHDRRVEELHGQWKGRLLPPSEGSEKVRGQLSVISEWSQDAGFKMTHLH